MKYFKLRNIISLPFTFGLLLIALQLRFRSNSQPHTSPSPAAKHYSLSPKPSILNSGFDFQANNLQRQQVQLSEGLFPVYPWKAICDERNENFPKAVILLVLTEEPLVRLRSNFSRQILKCVDPSGRLVFKYSRTFIPAGRQSRGLQLICPFQRHSPCPDSISLWTGNSIPITNELKVERQAEGQTNEAPSVVVCVPPISTSIATVTPRRIIEFIEYNKLIGIAKVVIDYYDPKLYETAVTEELERVFEYYENEGFLERHYAPIAVKLNGSLTYEVARFARSYQRTYCMLKHALNYDFIIAQDLDEVIAFDFNKFQTIKDAIWEAKRQSSKTELNIKIRDSIVNHECLSSAVKLNYSDFIIAKTQFYAQQSFNMGKTIHNSKACLYVMSHFCGLFRSVNFLSLAGEETKLVENLKWTEVGGTLELQLKRVEEPIMRTFHYKIVRYGNRTDWGWCKDFEFNRTEWIKPISTKLLRNSQDILDSVVNL